MLERRKKSNACQILLVSLRLVSSLPKLPRIYIDRSRDAVVAVRRAIAAAASAVHDLPTRYQFVLRKRAVNATVLSSQGDGHDRHFAIGTKFGNHAQA